MLHTLTAVLHLLEINVFLFWTKIPACPCPNVLHVSLDIGMDWLCPGFSVVLAQQLRKHHGNLTAENVIRDVVSIEQSGSLHIAVYDLTEDMVYIANAKASYESGPLDAYDR